MIGAVEGRLDVFDKISKLHAKNAFTIAIIIGDLFAHPAADSGTDNGALTSLLEGRISIPLPTYFVLGRYPLPQQVIEKLEQQDGELCANLYFLGKRSTTKTSEGLRIVALGGSLDSSTAAGLSTDKYLPFHTEGD